jgi:predicted secreted Zn-dependent protease
MLRHERSASTYSGRCAAALVAALLMVSLPLSAAPAFGELRHSTAYRQNPIRGTTPAELWRYMAAHPIIDEDGPALANITHDHTLSVKTTKSGGACRAEAIDFNWQFVITLPKAVDEARMSGGTRAMWREFTAYLKRHEEHHRAIFLGCGKDFLAKAAKISSARTCSGLERKIGRFIDKQYAACMTRQREFDRQEKQTVANLALRRAYRK